MIEREFNYFKNIQDRSSFAFVAGLFIRIIIYSKYSINRVIARKKGAVIGKNSIIPYSLAKRANKNLIVGDNVLVQTSKIDLRSRVEIGNNVIIGENVEILTCSHDIHSVNFTFQSNGISICDYAWLATKCFVLPSCRKIGYGVVVGAGAVVTKNIDDLLVVGGNPAKKISIRRTVHSNLIVPSHFGGDLVFYIKIRRKSISALGEIS